MAEAAQLIETELGTGLLFFGLVDEKLLSPVTLKVEESGSLDEHESERMLRLAEIYEGALHLFAGDKGDAREWLLSPVRGLNNNRPIDYARTDYGAREVRNLMGGSNMESFLDQRLAN